MRPGGNTTGFSAFECAILGWQKLINYRGTLTYFAQCQWRHASGTRSSILALVCNGSQLRPGE